MEKGKAKLQLQESIVDIPAHLYLRSPYGKEEKSAYRSKGHPLYIAARNGNWDEAKNIFDKDSNAVRAYITEGLETPLHISALADELEFVKKLVPLMEKKDLEITNMGGNTALCLAAVSGNVAIADVLISKHPELGQKRGGGGILPVMMAAMMGNGAMVEKLREGLDGTSWTEKDDAELLKECISSDLFDVALKMIEDLPAPAVPNTALEMLSGKPMAEKPKTRKWETFFDPGMAEARDEDLLEYQAFELLEFILKIAFSEESLGISNVVEKAPQLLFDAATRGNFHVFKLLIDYYPELVWKINSNGLSMFHVAVQHRHESIFSLLFDMDEVRRLVTTFIDKKTGDNMLHLAATLAPKDKLNTVAGAAFQMQRAIRWYKEVEKIVPPAYRNMRNNKGRTPTDIFDKEQKCLLKEGEKWMKATAKSCMLVAALIATVIFTAAFTVPGGNDNEGHPYLLNKVFFEFFSISEVIGMFSSSTSILIFLSILTSRANKYAFQHSLPCKLMIGVTTLFVSIASMVVAFCTTIFLSYGHTSTGVPILLLLFACAVPIMFISLKFRLLADIIHLTFVSRLLFPSRS